VPSVVEGPLAVKVLAPPKKELLINCAILPVSWFKHKIETAKDGKKLCAAIEVHLDCFSGRAIRGMAGIVKRHLQKLAIDLAVVIGKPENQDEDEPSACLGMWRFDHIDVSNCPSLPDRYAEEAVPEKGIDVDTIRATKIVKLSASEVASIAAQ